jgi:hypothetical protein
MEQDKEDVEDEPSNALVATEKEHKDQEVVFSKPAEQSPCFRLPSSNTPLELLLEWKM